MATKSSISKSKATLLTLLFSIFALGVWGQNFPEPQKPARLVNDFANMLSLNEERALEQKLRQFDDSTSTQIAIVSVEDLEGLSASQYATELAQKWGVGSAKHDNGVLILLKPKTMFSRGEVFIAVGYGLEGALPDVYASRIVREILIPAFKQNRIYDGLNVSVNRIISLTEGEYSSKHIKKEGEGLPTSLIVIIFIVILSIISSIRSKMGTTHTIDSTQTQGHVPPIIIFPSGRGGWGGGSGFGGGGGFGGFGGGGFGGGGAGGSW